MHACGTMAESRRALRSRLSLLCASLLLMVPCSGYAMAHVGRGGRERGASARGTLSKCAGKVAHEHPCGRDRGLLVVGVQALPAASRVHRNRVLKAVVGLRGGSPDATSPHYGSDAKDALAAISIPALSATGGPALFAQGLMLSLILSLDGFRIREHFVSYGYGFSVAAQAAAVAWLFRQELHTLSALHAAGLVAYGLRLALFCRWRDSLECFQNRKRRPPAQTSSGRPYNFWIICGMLYAFLALPTTYVARRLPPAEGWVGVSQGGLATMAMGLLVEAVADWQKSRFKKEAPNAFIDRGLFRFSRHANYFGEVVFWVGVYVAAIPSFAKWYHWALAAIGTSQIVSIILRATGGLEGRQAEKYGSTKEWKEYAASTPVLVPFTRHYTWKQAEKKK